MAGRNTIRDAVAVRCGFRTTLNDSIVAQMAVVQSSILEGGRLMPWFLLQKDQTLTVTANSRTVALPSSFIRWDDKAGLWLYDSSAAVADRYVARLAKQDWSYLVREYGELSGDDTEAYDYDGTNLYVFPKAGSNARTLKVNYYAKETNVSTGDIDNAWTTHAADLFEAETSIRMARILRDDKMLMTARDDRAMAYDRLIGSGVAREVEEMGREMGGPD